MSPTMDNVDHSQLAHPGGSNAKVVHMESSKLVPWLMLSCIVSALALGLVIANMVFAPQIIDAKLDARMAQLRAETAQQTEQAKATALAGNQHARIALDKVELIQIQLGQNGLIKTESH